MHREIKMTTTIFIQPLTLIFFTLSVSLSLTGAVPAIIAFPWRLRMHETETFERVKQDRVDAADRRAAQLQADNYTESNSNSGSGSGGMSGQHNTQYGSTRTTDNTTSATTSKSSVTSSRMEELRRTWHFYKYHMLGKYVRSYDYFSYSAFESGDFRH